MFNYKTSCKTKDFLVFFLLSVYVLNLGAQNKLITIKEKTDQDTIQAVPAPRVYPVRADTVFSNRIYKENFKIDPSRINIYDLPYSSKTHYPNYKRLALNTGVLYGAGVVALGVLYMLPEDATAWNKEEAMKTPLFKRWWNNVKKGPVIDKDNFVFNYILHPYGGAAYFMSARSLGFNFAYSCLYATLVSTFFWEYGIEAFMEIPSIQDLIITPIAGSVFGEGFYRLKRHIVDHGYTLFGSRILGNVVAFLVDPVNEVVGLFAGNPNREKLKRNKIEMACVPWFGRNSSQSFYGLSLSVVF